MTKSSALFPPRAAWLPGALASLVVLAVLLGGWWLATEAGWVSRAFVASPKATWASLERGLLSGELPAQTAGTVRRMLVGWGLACVAGMALGALIGASATARAWLGATLEFVRPLPASATLPLAISLFGLSDAMILTVVAFGAMWPVLLGTVHGLTTVHERLREVAQALQIPRRHVLWKIGLPNAVPDILSGVRLSLTVSLIVTVVGEMAASQAGLGAALLQSARAFRAPDLYAGIFVLGAIGFATNSLLAGVERHLLRWQQR